MSKHYKKLFLPEHPNAGTQGHVYEHRYLAEKFLGRYLTKDEIVHHKDGNKLNNSLDNLEVLSKYEHQRVHAEERALEECGNSSYMRCPYCKEYDNPDNMYVRKTQYQAWHRECAAAYKRVESPKTGPYKYNEPKVNKGILKLKGDTVE